MAYLFLTILAVFIYAVKPSWLMLLWLITVPFLCPFFVLQANIVDFEKVQSFNWLIWGVYNRVFLLIILFELVFRRKRNFKSLKVVLYSWLLLAFYLVIHNLITHPEIKTIYENVVGALYTISPMVVMFLNRNARPKLRQLYVVSIIIIVVQLIWLPLNMEGLFAYMSRYQEIAINKDEATLMPGTFTRSNVLADVVSIIFLFIYLDYFLRKRISFIYLVVISIGVMTLLFFAGSKLPIIVTIFGLSVCAIFFSRKGLLTVLIMGILGASLLVFLSTTDGDVSENEGVNRVVNGLSDFVKSRSKGKEDNSTFRLTGKLIDKYFWESPLFGNGYSYKGNERAYPTDNSALDLVTIKADATFAYYLIEFGILGVILYLLYYYNIISCASKFLKGNSRRVTFVVFSFFLLLSITEGGLFNREFYLYIFTYLFALQRWYEEKGIIHQNA
jgi:hypothetical protein